MQVRVAALQQGPAYGASSEVLEKCVALLRSAVEAEKPDLAVFSELMTSVYFGTVKDDKYFDRAEPVDGPTVNTFIKEARDLGVHVVPTFFERDGANFYNSAAVISPTKGLLGVYRKVHMPMIDSADFFVDEKYYFERFGGGGKEFKVFTLDNGVRFGLLICYDRTFPEAWRSLALQGAQVVGVPVCTWGFRKEAFVIELRTRAMENGFYVVAANRAGEEQVEGEKTPRQHFGLSVICSPTGDVVAQAESEPWSFVAADLDLSKVEFQRSRINWPRDRRPEAYGFTTR